MHMPEMHTSLWDLGGVEYPIPVGRVVRALRLARGIDQVRFAQALALSQGHLSKIERGQGKLSIEHWMYGAKALAVGAPRELDFGEGFLQGDQPLFVLALPEKRADHPGTVRLLAGEDRRTRVFHEAESALFATAVFERMCSPEVCVIPVWPDLIARIQGHRPVFVPAQQPGSERDVFQVRLEELDAATTIARAWLETTKVQTADYHKVKSAPDPRKAFKEYYLRHIGPTAYRLPPKEDDSLVMVDAAGKETLWPPMD
jgi:transcriptional regulator with XRE-family HTH domain